MISKSASFMQTYHSSISTNNKTANSTKFMSKYEFAMHKDYQTPFRFTGKLDKLTLTIDRPELSEEDIKKLKMAMHGNSASE